MNDDFYKDLMPVRILAVNGSSPVVPMTSSQARSTASIKLKLYALLSMLIVGYLLTPNSVYAAHFELTPLAGELNQASLHLANDLRHLRGYGNVSNKANRLSRETIQFITSLARNRSDSYIRSKYNDVSRYYARLEDEFLKANRRHGDAHAFDEFTNLNAAFMALNESYYYHFGSARNYSQSFYFSPPHIYIPWRLGSDHHDSSRSNVRPSHRRDNDRRDNDRHDNRRPNNRNDDRSHSSNNNSNNNRNHNSGNDNHRVVTPNNRSTSGANRFNRRLQNSDNRRDNHSAGSSAHNSNSNNASSNNRRENSHGSDRRETARPSANSNHSNSNNNRNTNRRQRNTETSRRNHYQ